VAVILATASAAAQPSPKTPLTRMEAPSEPDAIPFDPAQKNAGPFEQWTRFFGQPVARNVTRATVTPFLPTPDKSTGAAVIVAPGGGFKMLSMENEGWAVARWLADHGVAAFVLKYRLNPTAVDEAAFGRDLMAMFTAFKQSGTNAKIPEEPRATQDALSALRYVRANANRWGVDPSRVGMMGFSAGAITTLNATLEGRSDERPAFIGYIYGPMGRVSVPDDAPPMFAALAVDDDLFGGQGYGIVEAWRQAKRPVELHAYEKGGHGFGMGNPGTTTTGMIDQFYAWLGARGILAKN
jgi:acetyl esterase/lipase